MTGEQQLAIWCKRGHLLDDENTYPGRGGVALCSECLREHLAAVRRFKRRRDETA
jgi:hypothetical protein